MYKDGIEVVSLIFDGKNSDKLSWFSRDKLLFTNLWTSSLKETQPTGDAGEYFAIAEE